MIDRVLAAVRRRPVRLYLYGLLVPGFGVALAYGLTTADHAALWITLGGAVLVVGGGEVAQTKTTPVADPRDQSGDPLLPARRPGGPINPLGGIL